RQNLQRLRDVMEEVRRQLGSIERQARKARQYKALHQERQMLDLALLAADFETLAVEHQRLADEMAQYRRGGGGDQGPGRVTRRAARASRGRDPGHGISPGRLAPGRAEDANGSGAAARAT